MGATQLSTGGTKYPRGALAALFIVWGVAGTYPAALTRVSPIWELAIHLVSSTVVRAWGSLPMSFTVMMRWREDLSSFTASSWGMLRKLRPFTSRIWSPTCRVRAG